MFPEEYEYLYQLEEKFWWFVGMRHISDAVVGRRLNNGGALKILDVGCGTGFNMAHLSSFGPHEVFGFDLSADALNGVQKRGLRKVCQASVTDIPFASSTFDFVFCFDVLYQLTEPLGAGLREIHRVLREGGFLFIREPAFQWMQSSHDVAVGGSRRFTRAEIQQSMLDASLGVEWSSYANCFLFPAVVVRRMLKAVGIGKGSDVRPLPDALGWIDPIFRDILKFEAAIFRSGFRLPFGLSVICLARKP